MDVYTTRIDGVNDANVVDLGYHYRQGAAQYQLNVTVVDGNGTVEPNSGWYYEGTQLTLKAKPEPGYYVKGWYDNNG
ncbi:MAG: InlB B-repeat-containing protein, partial [Planctomycetota bacterium]